MKSPQIIQTSDITAVRIYRSMLAMVVLAGIGIAYFAIIPAAHVSRLRLTANFFSYFTIQTNTLVFLGLVFSLAVPWSRPGQWAQCPPVRSALLSYVVMTSVIYALVLQTAWRPTGWQARGDQILHYAVPVLYAIDWLFWVRRGALLWRHALWWLLFPAVYAVYTLIHGYFSGFYPYPFIDVPEIGLDETAVNMAWMTAGFLGLGTLVVTIDRLACRYGARNARAL